MEPSAKEGDSPVDTHHLNLPLNVLPIHILVTSLAILISDVTSNITRLVEIKGDE